ncbi:hypothetical protein ACS0Y7_36610 [Burkholderia gladioli]
MKADLARLPQAAKAYIHELETGLAERDARIDGKRALTDVWPSKI